MKIILIIILTILYKIRADNLTGLAKLFNKIFVQDEYNNMVRPYNFNKMTKVETELKLLQIDLVNNKKKLIYLL
jgi:hypothetical protein